MRFGKRRALPLALPLAVVLGLGLGSAKPAQADWPSTRFRDGPCLQLHDRWPIHGAAGPVRSLRQGLRRRRPKVPGRCQRPATRVVGWSRVKAPRSGRRQRLWSKRMRGGWRLPSGNGGSDCGVAGCFGGMSCGLLGHRKGADGGSWLQRRRGRLCDHRGWAQRVSSGQSRRVSRSAGSRAAMSAASTRTWASSPATRVADSAVAAVAARAAATDTDSVTARAAARSVEARAAGTASAEKEADSARICTASWRRWQVGLHRPKMKWFVGAGGPVPFTPGYVPYIVTTRSPRDFFAFPPMNPNAP